MENTFYFRYIIGLLYRKILLYIYHEHNINISECVSILTKCNETINFASFFLSKIPINIEFDTKDLKCIEKVKTGIIYDAKNITDKEYK